MKHTGNLVKDKGRKAYKDIQTRINNGNGGGGGGQNDHNFGHVVGSPLRRHSSGTIPAPLQRMHTSPHIRLTGERGLPPERPPPPKRPTSPPPAVPVVNDLICLDESPKKNGHFNGFEDSFVNFNGHNGVNGHSNGSLANNTIISSGGLSRENTPAIPLPPEGGPILRSRPNSIIHTSTSDNALASKFYSVDFDSRPSPVTPIQVQELISTFNGLQMDQSGHELSNAKTSPNALPVLQPPPRKTDLKRHPNRIRPPRAGHVLHLLNEGTREDTVANRSDWQTQQASVASTNPFVRHL